LGFRWAGRTIHFFFIFRDFSMTISILFLSADPTDAARLRLGEEYREIQETATFKERDNFILGQRFLLAQLGSESGKCLI
jgi:hypothetical protein